MTVLKSTQTRFVGITSHPLHIPTLAYHDQRILTLIANDLNLKFFDVHQPVSARIPFLVFLTLCLSENFTSPSLADPQTTQGAYS